MGVICRYARPCVFEITKKLYPPATNILQFLQFQEIERTTATSWSRRNKPLAMDQQPLCRLTKSQLFIVHHRGTEITEDLIESGKFGCGVWRHVRQLVNCVFWGLKDWPNTSGITSRDSQDFFQKNPPKSIIPTKRYTADYIKAADLKTTHQITTGKSLPRYHKNPI